MSKKKSAQIDIKLKDVSSVEWVGGILSMPAFVMDADAPYQPKVLLWMASDGSIIKCIPAKPDEVDLLVKQSLQEALDEHPENPTHLRVSSNELANGLRPIHPNLNITHAPTPELNNLIEEMNNAMGGEVEESYLSAGVEPESIASFFKSSTQLYDAKPWNIVPCDECILSVTIESLDVKDYIVSIIGQLEESFGLLLFKNIDGFNGYLNISTSNMSLDDLGSIPPHYALNFDKGADISKKQRKEVAQYKWKVSDSNAYPWLAHISEDLSSRSLTLKEYMIIEAIALALVEILKEEKALLSAWAKEASIERTYSVCTGQGNIEVTLQAPCEINRGG